MQNQDLHFLHYQILSLPNPVSFQPKELGDWKNGLKEKTQTKERSKQGNVYTGSKDPWTEEEEFKMIVAHKKYKNKWSDMTDLLKRRNNNTIKNKFYSVFRKIKGKVQKADYSYESKLELLEIHYIVALIIDHLEHPTMYPKAKGKRGKDFIYSLIHNLTLEMVQDYKKQIEELTKDEGSIEDLIKQLTDIYQNSSGVRTAYQTPELSHPLSESKIKSIHIENQFTLQPNIELEELFNTPFRLPNLDNSPLLEIDQYSPGQPASPSSLSAGPAAAAARAPQAACFGGFGDVSAVAKTLAEEKIGTELMYREHLV